MPPNQLPKVATHTHVQLLNPAAIKAENTTSELNGTTVAARNEAINNPKYPNSIHSVIVVEIKY